MALAKWFEDKQEDKSKSLGVEGARSEGEDEAVFEYMAEIMNHCYKALTKLEHTDSNSVEYKLWCSLVSLSKAVLATWTLLQNEGLLDLADMLIKDVEKLRRPKLVEDGIVEVKYVLRRDAIPEEIEGKKDEVLKKVESYLSVKYKIREEFKELVKKLVESPMGLELENLEDPRVRKLIESGLCKLYLIPTGYPVADAFWFIEHLAPEAEHTAVKEHVEEIEELANALPKPIFERLRAHIGTLNQLLNTFEGHGPVTCPYCGSSNTRLVYAPMDMRGDYHPRYQCLECKKVFQK
jgi:hypothetical protein